MTASPCVRCGRPIADGAYACSSCADRAGRQLAEIADLAPDAREIARGLSARLRAETGSGVPGPRIQLNFSATARLDAIANELGTLARMVAEERHGSLWVWMNDAIVEASLWLTSRLDWLRHHPAADEHLTTIDVCARVMRGVVNQGRDPGRYAGPCSTVGPDGRTCGEDVTARTGSNVAVCSKCGSEYDVDEQQRWMLGEIEDYLATSVEIAGVLLRLGFPIGYSTIAAYAAKGRIVQRGHDEQDRPVYRIGDVIDLRMGAKKR